MYLSNETGRFLDSHIGIVDPAVRESAAGHYLVMEGEHLRAALCDRLNMVRRIIHHQMRVQKQIRDRGDAAHHGLSE